MQFLKTFSHQRVCVISRQCNRGNLIVLKINKLKLCTNAVTHVEGAIECIIPQ